MKLSLDASRRSFVIIFISFPFVAAQESPDLKDPTLRNLLGIDFGCYQL
jgi:hypothetical protein